MKENLLRKKMKKEEPTIGTRVLIPWPGIVEIVGHTGMYDYVEFLSEYAPYDLFFLDNFGRAAELVNLSTMIKLDQEPRKYLAGRALAAGIQNILFADIRSVEDAEEAVYAVRAEPKGLSGFRLDRRVGYGAGVATPADVVKICEDAVIALMIEKKTAVENLEAILSVEGIDMIQFGPSDYSLSIGLPGETMHPKVKKAEVKTIKMALKMGVSPRVEISSPDQVKKYIEFGVRDFNINIDVRILYSWWRENGIKLKKTLSE